MFHESQFLLETYHNILIYTIIMAYHSDTPYPSAGAEESDNL